LSPYTVGLINGCEDLSKSPLSIAAKMKTFGFSWETVKEANPKVDWNDLKTGQKINVPSKN